LPATVGDNLSRQPEEFYFFQPERKIGHRSQQAFANIKFLTCDQALFSFRSVKHSGGTGETKNREAFQGVKATSDTALKTGDIELSKHRH